MTIDPRMARRRRDVAEDRARLDVRRVVWLLVLLASLGSAAWLATSSLLSVQTVTIHGAANAGVEAVLVAERVVEGRPLVLIRAERVAEAIEQDPWVRSAGVELVFPSLVEVTIEERVGVAWVPTATGWGLVADDGVMVDRASEPTGRSLVQIRTDDPGLGERVTEDTVLGAVVFLRALDPVLARDTTVRLADGELWAWVGERNVRLGRAIDMEAKASALQAIIESAPPGVIDLIAPARPAVRSEPSIPEPQPEGESQSLTDG